MKCVIRGFTLFELIVVLSVGVLVAGCFLLALKIAKPRIVSVTCKSRLMEIGAAYRGYAVDHDMMYPLYVLIKSNYVYGQKTTSIMCYQGYKEISNYLSTPLRLVCPKDKRTASTNWGDLKNINISYFVGIYASPLSPESILSGDRNITPNTNCVVGSNDLSFTWQASVGLHGHFGNILYSDGHVDTVNDIMVSNVMRDKINITNRYAIP